ncbi:MAG: heme-binding domain-containing protein [Bacteroidales bacterium]|nr:heme-binding domain-containing protein [Bacteroidales bacterium]
MKAVKIISAVLIIILIILQFFPKRLPENLPLGPSDLISGESVPGEVVEILRNSCFDCHSNQVHYPWYSYVVPTAWLVGKDVREGRGELNFSEWGDYSLRNLIGRLDAIKEEVSSGAMPLPAYIFMHPKAKLDEEQVSIIVKWTDDYIEKILE